MLGDAGPFLLLLVGIGLVIAFGIGAWTLDRKRREAMFAWCALHGWTFVGEDESLTYRWSGAPFGTGERRRARNVMRGPVGDRQVVVFDYSYETSTTDSKGHRQTTTHRFAVVAVGLPVPLPRLQVTPDNVFKRAAAAIGLGDEDIHLESDEFNKRFRVTARDRKFAFDVLHPRLMHALLATEPVAWRFEGTDLLSWDSGRVTPDQAFVRAMMLSSVIDAVPTFVWKDRGYDPSSAGPPGETAPRLGTEETS